MKIINLKEGFPALQPEAGVHLHGLDRQEGLTLEDGPHLHLFILPDGTGIITEEDGAHSHPLTDDGNKAENGGVHNHRVLLPGGIELFTEEDGEHDHVLLVRVSGFDGTHDHILVLPDGTEIKSISAGEFSEMFPDNLPPESPGPATGILAEAFIVQKQGDDYLIVDEETGNIVRAFKTETAAKQEAERMNFGGKEIIKNPGREALISSSCLSNLLFLKEARHTLRNKMKKRKNR